MTPPLVPQSTAQSNLGCVEIKTTLGETSERLPPTAALLWFEFDNRCDTAIRMDWRALRVTGTVSRWRQGVTPEQDDEEEIVGPVPLSLVKPSGVGEGRLDARSKGNEAMRFDVREQDRLSGNANSDDPRGGHEGKNRRHRRFDPDPRLTKICVDLGAVTEPLEGEPSRASIQSAFCIETPRRTQSVVATSEHTSPSPMQPYYTTSYDGHYRFEDHYFGGSWNSRGFPRLTLDTGFTVHSIALRDHELSTGTFKVDGSQIGDRLYAGAFELRMKGYLAGPFYMGADFGVGLGGSRRTILVDRATGRTESLTADPSGVLTGGAFAGLSGRAGVVQPFAEIGAGGQGIFYTLAGASETASRTKIDAWWGTITPRGGVDVWIHPNMTLGAYAGVDALRTETWFAGVRFSAHLRAFDGR